MVADLRAAFARTDRAGSRHRAERSSSPTSTRSTRDLDRVATRRPSGRSPKRSTWQSLAARRADDAASARAWAVRA